MMSLLKQFFQAVNLIPLEMYLFNLCQVFFPHTKQLILPLTNL